MTKLTPTQRIYLARRAIVDALGDLEALQEMETGIWPTLSELIDAGYSDSAILDWGYTASLLEGYRLARTELEKARVNVAEQAAYAVLMGELAAEHPDWTQRDLQRLVRKIIADDPDTRERAARDAGVFDRLDNLED